jgi:hypothetical protein
LPEIYSAFKAAQLLKSNKALTSWSCWPSKASNNINTYYKTMIRLIIVHFTYVNHDRLF